MNPLTSLATLADTAARGIVRPRQRSADMFGDSFSFNGNSYPLGLNQTLIGNKEEIDGSFVSFANQAYKSNGVVFACMLVRMSLFSQVRFMFQEIRKGIPGDLFSTEALGALNEDPAPGETTGDLLARTITHSDLAGNAFIVKHAGEYVNLRPDWVTIVLGSDDPAADANASGARKIGYIYHPGGRASSSPIETFLPEEVCHFAPIKDPMAHYRGMSWLQPVVREIQGDLAANDFKTLYYTNGATPNLVVSFDASIKQEAFEGWIREFEKNHVGVANAYKTLYMGAGATATRIGSTFAEGDFRAVQGASETRIVAAAGLHPTIVGLSEGLQGSSLNQGNFTAAARLTSDKTFRYLWSQFAGSMQTIITPPQGSRLWYDASQVDFLKDDEKDRSANLQVQAISIQGLIREGFTAASAVDAVISGDFRRLTHTGLFSVQLQAPGSTKMPTGEVPGELPVGDAPVAKVVPPKQLPATTTKSVGDADVFMEARCSNPDCGKGGKPYLFLERASAPWHGTCPRCKTFTSVGLAPDVSVERTSQDLGAMVLALMTREQPVAPSVTFAEGAFQVHAAPAPNVTIAEGAIRSEVHIAAPETPIPEPPVTPEPKTVRTEIVDPIRGTIVITETEQ